jgi:hypothetical protein
MSSPVQSGPAPALSLSLDAATVNIFLAQCLGVGDGTRSSMMSYADGEFAAVLKTRFLV